MKRRPGFTLIEVLVVVAIIALLISILLPSLKQAREQSKVTVCASQLHQVGVAIHTYASDVKGWIPPYYLLGATKGGEPVTSFGNGVNSGGPGLLLRQPVGWGMAAYLNNTDPFYCPSDTVMTPHHRNGKWSPDKPIDPYAPLNPNAFSSVNAYTSYWYMYVSESGKDSGDIAANRPGYYDGFQRAHVDRVKIVRGKQRGNKNKTPTIMSDMGIGGFWSMLWPLTHRPGWNTLRIDASVRFIKKNTIDAKYTTGGDIWMSMMEQFDLR
jgi:prepilin-type N-terminal cleavage/methylation domain-containing protein